MNLLVVALFFGVFASEYLARQLRVVPAYFALLPELLAGIAMLIVLVRMVGGQRFTLDWRYGLFLTLFAFCIAFGFLAQDVPSGAMLSGLRNYAKFAPFFLLPLVYPFTDRQLKVQAIVFLALMLVQSPLAVYQRFVQFAGRMHTGDPIRGFAATSSSLSLLLLCAIVFVVVLYLRRKIKLLPMLLAFGALFLPTTLNETKATILLLPIALLMPAFLMPAGARAFKRLVPVMAAGAGAAVCFFAVYNHFVRYNSYGPQSLQSFLTEGHMESYLYTGAADGEDRWIGRFDSIALATSSLASDPLALAFGLGAGNVSTSIMPQFDGVYADYVTAYGTDVTQISQFIWEIGIVGMAVYLLFYLFVYSDARFLARREGSSALIGQVWATVTVIMTFALVYKSVLSLNEVSYPFWYFSGVVARKAWEARRRRVVAPAAERRPALASNRLAHGRGA